MKNQKEKPQQRKEKSNLDKIINDIDIDIVKLIGSLKKGKERIEIILDKNLFFEWIEMIKKDYQKPTNEKPKRKTAAKKPGKTKR